MILKQKIKGLKKTIKHIFSEGFGKYPYKIVDSRYKNNFLVAVSSQLRGKNIVFEESLVELVSRNKTLSGYSSKDVGFILNALYERKHKPRYKIQSLSHGPSGDVMVVLYNLLEDNVVQYKVSKLLEIRNIIDQVVQEDRNVIIYHTVQAAIKSQNESMHKLQNKQNRTDRLRWQ